jgi:outer membrane protein insertion porin family
MQAFHRSPSLLFALLLTLGSASSLILARPSHAQTLEPVTLGKQSSIAIAASADSLAEDSRLNPAASDEAIARSPAETPAEIPAETPATITIENGQPVGEAHMPQLRDSQPNLLSTQADDLMGDRAAADGQFLQSASGSESDGTVLSDPRLLASWETAQAYSTPRGNSLRFRLEPRLPVPTALQGSSRARTVRLPDKVTGIAAVVSLNQPLGGDSSLNAVVEGGEHILAFDIEYLNATPDPRRGFGINIFNQRSWVPAFRGGDRDVDLANGNTPWVHRLGGGVEFFLPIADNFDSALGVSYQRVSVRDDVFTSELEPFDELGNELTVDSDGIDDLLIFRAAAVIDNRDTPTLTTTGNRIRFGIDQGFTLGAENIAFARLAANYTQYIPFNLFGFSAGPRTLVLNVQGGTFLGDVPPYEAFNLGGTNSVRGYRAGSVGTGSRFVQATAEYRFPVASLSVFNTDLDLRGALFVDYGTDLGSADDVIGEPGEVRDKPGDGLGFGAGLQAQTPFGFARLEFAVNDNGGSQIIATFGDRF